MEQVLHGLNEYSGPPGPPGAMAEMHQAYPSQHRSANAGHVHRAYPSQHQLATAGHVHRAYPSQHRLANKASVHRAYPSQHQLAKAEMEQVLQSVNEYSGPPSVPGAMAEMHRAYPSQHRSANAGHVHRAYPSQHRLANAAHVHRAYPSQHQLANAAHVHRAYPTRLSLAHAHRARPSFSDQAAYALSEHRPEQEDDEVHASASHKASNLLVKDFEDGGVAWNTATASDNKAGNEQDHAATSSSDEMDDRIAKMLDGMENNEAFLTAVDTRVQQLLKARKEAAVASEHIAAADAQNGNEKSHKALLIQHRDAPETETDHKAESNVKSSHDAQVNMAKSQPSALDHTADEEAATHGARPSVHIAERIAGGRSDSIHKAEQIAGGGGDSIHKAERITEGRRRGDSINSMLSHRARPVSSHFRGSVHKAYGHDAGAAADHATWSSRRSALNQMSAEQMNRARAAWASYARQAMAAASHRQASQELAAEPMSEEAMMSDADLDKATQAEIVGDGNQVADHAFDDLLNDLTW